MNNLIYPSLTMLHKLFQSNCIVFFVFDFLYIQHHKAAHRCSKYLDDKHGESPNSLIYSNLTNYPKLYHHHYRFLFLFDYLYSPHHRLVYRYLLSSQYKLLMHNSMYSKQTKNHILFHHGYKYVFLSLFQHIQHHMPLFPYKFDWRYI